MTIMLTRYEYMQCLVSFVEDWFTYLIKCNDSEQSRYRGGCCSFGRMTGLGRYETFQWPTSFHLPFTLPVSYSSDGRGSYLLIIPHSPTQHQPTHTQPLPYLHYKSTSHPGFTSSIDLNRQYRLSPTIHHEPLSHRSVHQNRQHLGLG